jgi:hypothetical protein
LGGEFKIILPKDFKKESVTLILHYIGYERKEFVIHQKDFSSENILKLPPSRDVIMGDLIIIKSEE